MTIAVPVAETIRTLAETPRSADVSLKRMGDGTRSRRMRECALL
jgi:hypothetical protein